jgi:hypothetical protein
MWIEVPPQERQEQETMLKMRMSLDLKTIFKTSYTIKHLL